MPARILPQIAALPTGTLYSVFPFYRPIPTAHRAKRSPIIFGREFGQKFVASGTDAGVAVSNLSKAATPFGERSILSRQAVTPHNLRHLNNHFAGSAQAFLDPEDRSVME